MHSLHMLINLQLIQRQQHVLKLTAVCLLLCAVLGGGYIALEFAGIFQRFGTEVHTVFRQPQPLRGFDEEVSQGSTGHQAG